MERGRQYRRQFWEGACPDSPFRSNMAHRDYRKLLDKYVTFVRQEEGTDFLDRLESNRSDVVFTPDDVAALRQIERLQTLRWALEEKPPEVNVVLMDKNERWCSEKVSCGVTWVKEHKSHAAILHRNVVLPFLGSDAFPISVALFNTYMDLIQKMEVELPSSNVVEIRRFNLRLSE